MKATRDSFIPIRGERLEWSREWVGKPQRKPQHFLKVSLQIHDGECGSWKEALGALQVPRSLEASVFMKVKWE